MHAESTAPQMKSEADPLPAELRQLLVDHHMRPLWESPSLHAKAASPDSGHLWAWAHMRPILLAVGRVTSPAVVERRVLSLLDPRTNYPDGEATVGTVNATLQLLNARDRARPHRHTMDALRFVLEGRPGAHTVVDGLPCAMEPGDLVLTPGWTWHEHVNDGDAPVMWLDVLDVALQRFLRTEVFEPGPMHDPAPQWQEQVFPAPGIVPEVDWRGRDYSPVLRYPWAAAAASVANAPLAADGCRRVRYVNPLTGRSCLARLEPSLIQVDAACATRPTLTTASTVCCVVEGCGESEIAGRRFAWQPRDVFTVPPNVWAHHEATRGTARIFQVSDAEALRRLGLFEHSLA